MDEKTLLALFDRFEKSTAVELKFADGATSFELRRKEAFVAPAAYTSAPATLGTPAVSITSHEIPQTAAPAPHTAAGATAPGNELIKSPVVGTFYRAASPDAPPFADPGMKIVKGQKICIIEAMKMMNALEAELDCEIVKVLVNNGDMVEFDQPLFEVRKS